MNKMDDKHRYHPYYQTKNYNDKRYTHHYRHDDRLNNKNHMDFSNQHSQRNQYQQSKTYSYFSAPSSLPLMPPKTVPPSTLHTAIPHERESWIRSVKKTKTNESIEQKTQYLETILRMPQQQKSSMNSSTFDRIRFADDQRSTTTHINENNNNLNDSSFHLIGDINNHDDIYTIEKILFNNELQPKTEKYSNQIIACEPTLQTNSEPRPCSGFLIDNCDEEELPPLSPPSCPRSSLLPSTTEESIQQNQEDLNEERIMLVSELDAADAERRQELKRQKRLHKKLQKKKKQSKQSKTTTEDQQINTSETISTVNNNDHQELSSNWIVEYNITELDRISQLTDTVRRMSTTMSDKDKIAKVNIILKKIKKQQIELRKLRQYVMSMLNEEQQQNSTNTKQQTSHINQDLLMTFLNQPITSGCWLCSGKTYTEVATQCNNVNEQ